MKIIASEKTRQTIDEEFGRFMADPNNLARLKMKLSYNQRVFIESLQAAYNQDSDDLKAEDKLLIFQETILTFNARPELVPNAPIELLKKSISFKNAPDDFEQLIVMIKVWKRSVRKSKKPINRLAIFFAKWYKLVLYPFFVGMLTWALTSLLTFGATFMVYGQLDAIHLSVTIVAGFVSIAAGKGIYYRLLITNQNMVK